MVALCGGIANSACAQFLPKSNDLANQRDLINRYTQLRQRTLQLARQQGWPLRKNYSKHRILQLQDVDETGQPVYYTLHNTEAARGTRTLALQGNGILPVSLSGNLASMVGRLGLWDGGRVLDTHQEFGGAKITQKDNGAAINDHTTHLAGTLVGRGINPLAKGMAFGGQLSVWDYTNDIAELATAAPDLLISNHAYGPVAGWVYNESRPGTNPDLKWEWWGNTTISTTEDYIFGFYNTKAQDLDRLAYSNPFFLMVRSADNKRSETGPPNGTPYYLKNSATQSTLTRNRNDEYDVIPADATAKNVLTVGAAAVAYTVQNEPVLRESTAFSGWGPTDDGRIKPDLLGIGTAVLSSIATGNAEYSQYSGTSMASANVSGSLFLLQELYARQRVTGLPPGGQFMRAATLKGLVLHTADRPNPSAGPDYRQGWGLLNTEAAARVLLNETQAHLLVEQSLMPGSTFSRTLVAQGNEPLIITLSWTDPEGVATPVSPAYVNNRTPKLINDLDLRLTDGQYTDLPFVLNPARPAQAAARGDNTVDNVEQVHIANPVPGKTYTLTVSHKGVIRYSSQPFSVVVSGLQRAGISNCQLGVSLLPGGSRWLCSAGTPVSLAAIVTGGATSEVTFSWFLNGAVIGGVSGSTYQATQPGRYQVQVTQNGCRVRSAETQVLMTTINDFDLLPEETELKLPQGATVTLTAPFDTSYRYQWYRNKAPLPNALNYQLLVERAGTYNVQITQHGCTSQSPNRLVETSLVTATLPDPTGQITLYPNPAEHTLFVRYANPINRQVLVSIIDQNSGLQLPPLLLNAKNGQVEGTLSVQTLPAGPYVLQLTDGERTQTVRFVKK